eukprot:1186245-Prorocentrum_minimum.AAC.5
MEHHLIQVEFLNPFAPQQFVKGDITSPDLVNYLLSSEKIDTIMHFAAQTHVDNSFGNSFEFTMNNIYGTHVLLESARVVGGIKRFIHVSTDEVYGESSVGLDSGNHEKHPLEPTNPYAATKAGAEMLVKAYHTSYKLPIITTRGNNVYGPQQYPEKLVPKFILLAKRGSLPLPIHGDGMACRSYFIQHLLARFCIKRDAWVRFECHRYVEDVAAAFDAILHKGVIGEIYNVGTTVERNVRSVAEDICKHFSLDPKSSLNSVEDRAFNDQRYFLETSKLAELGWEAKVQWEDGLKRTVDWYLEHGETWFETDLSTALRAHPGKAAPPDANKV